MSISLNTCILILKEHHLLKSSAVQDTVQTKMEYVSYDSRDVQTNTLFFCKGAGFRPTYLSMAREDGAIAYVAEQPYPEGKGMHVVTTGIDTALACTDAGIDTCLLGGKIKQETHAIIGAAALDRLRRLNFNAAFIGANAMSREGTLTTPDTEEASIKQAAIEQSQAAYVLIDRSKFDAVTFAEFANVQQVVVITRLKAADRRKMPANIQLEEAE